MIQELTIEKAGEVIEKRTPKGLFLAQDKEVFVAIDNLTKDAWTEEFKTKVDAMNWLNRTEVEE